MTDDLPTLWRAEPHTLAKHAILQRYLQAWFPILSQQSRRVQRSSEEILFIDGFAGPGEYVGGEPGSPVIAIGAALEHSVKFPVPARFLFIELDRDRYDHLRCVLSRLSDSIKRSSNVQVSPPLQGECNAVLAQMLDEHERKGTHFGPALAFLDQFGYSAVSMELMARLLAYPRCEVFSYLNYTEMDRFISDPSKEASFTRTWGGDEWQQAIRMPKKDRQCHLRETYEDALRSRANVKYVQSFAMHDSSGRLLYWLIFCTNHLRGLEEMKKAMWKIDDSGEYRFSDRDDPGQLKLLKEAFDQDWLAETLAEKLAGKRVTAADVKEYVLAETQCCLFKGALKALETGKDASIRIMKAPEKRRRGTYPDTMLHEIEIQFESRLRF
ncbi:MAG: three-Cys-motif partner protein TcmP [Planctomycetes bacterium]|nr:three-Cys-motif partner protein TcmP [Planctomycetota bacterium]